MSSASPRKTSSGPTCATDAMVGPPTLLGIILSFYCFWGVLEYFDKPFTVLICHCRVEVDDCVTSDTDSPSDFSVFPEHTRSS